MNTPRILLTAFEPFGGDPVNPSLLIARALDGEVVSGARVEAVELPCVFHRALSALDEALARTQPVLAVALGLAAGREGLSIERVAINVDDAEAEAKRDELQPGHTVTRLTWSLAMRRTFKIDALACDKCGGRREVIALIPSGEIATKILGHLKLPVEAEGFLPIRAPPWTEDFGWLAANDEVDQWEVGEDAA